MMKKKNLMLMLGFMIIAVLVLNFINAQGCCFNPSNGLCSDNAEEDKCTPFGGEYHEGLCDAQQECQKGCCVLGAKTQFATIAQCEVLSARFGFQFPDNYKEKIDEAECRTLNSSQARGACVKKGTLPDENNCVWTTETECKGVFNKNLLCTAKELKTICKKTTNTILQTGADEVYYVDSCGNPANIYDSERYNTEDYWTHIYAKSQSCGPNQSNANSKTCGNCNYNLSSLGRIADSKTATPTYGKYICADLSCIESDGTKRQNGETWCTYDSRKEIYLTHFSKSYPIGDVPQPKGLFFYTNGLSVPVGSRFFKQSCVNGKIEVEPCADYRDERCLSGKCVKNDWQTCLDATKKNDCISHSQCMWYDGETNCGKIKANSSRWTSDSDFISLAQTNPSLKNAEFAYCSEGNKIIALSSVESVGKLEDLTNYASVASIPVGAEFKSNTITDFYSSSGASQCFPALPGGFKFWNYAGKKSSKCSAGSVSITLEFKYNSKSGYWHFMTDKSEKDYFGTLGLTASNIINWGWYDDTDGAISLDGSLATELGTINSAGSGSISLNKWHTNGIESQCKMISDCDGKSSWLAASSSKTTSTGKAIENSNSKITGDATMTGYATSSDSGGQKATCTKSGYTIKCEWSYTCYPWQAAKTGNCEKCGADGFECSEYRCKSLGKNCEFAVAGDGTGYCKSSNDKTAPVITPIKYPTQPVEPYSAVEFEIKTSEVTSCKFDLNNTSYEKMKYDFGEDVGVSHKVILYPPAYSKGLEEELSAYGILKKDGKYTMFIQCMDGIGNIGYNQINFDVMTTPDIRAPRMLGFDPVSGSFIEYNTNSKKITIKLDEPAECKWDIADKDFKLMKNSFSCETSLKSDGLVLGYFCAGNISNVTKVLGEESKVYIRCKDQPWLEGNEDNFYSRNANSRGTEYILRPSAELKIVAISPTGKTIIGPGEQLQLKVLTSGGAFSGRVNCTFTLPEVTGANDSMIFQITNTNLNKHNLSLGNGIYSAQITCKDVAGNIAKGSTGFSLLLDKRAPVLNKIYEYGGSLRIITNENSKCYYALNKKAGCLENIENLTLMEGINKEHTAGWLTGGSYYIKCADYFGNYDKVCGSIVKTY